MSKACLLTAAQGHLSSRFAQRLDLPKALYIGDETREQRRGVVFSPSERHRQWHIQIGDPQDDDLLRAPPARRLIDPSHAHATQD